MSANLKLVSGAALASIAQASLALQTLCVEIETVLFDDKVTIRDVSLSYVPKYQGEDAMVLTFDVFFIDSRDRAMQLLQRDSRFETVTSSNLRGQAHRVKAKLKATA